MSAIITLFNHLFEVVFSFVILIAEIGSKSSLSNALGRGLGVG